MATSKLKIFTAAFSFVWCVFASPTLALSQQLVSDGGFEDADYFIDGWIQGGTPGYTSVEDSAADAHTGNRLAALSPGNSSGSLYQNLATIPGQTYVISFWLNTANAADVYNGFAVSWDGQVLFNQTQLETDGYTNFVFTNAATSTNTILRFDFFFAQTFYEYLLDDVSVLPLNLAILPPPANDNFSNALTIAPPFYQLTVTNLHASRETNEPDHGSPFFDPLLGFTDPGGEGNSSVWWKFTAPADGYLNLTVSPFTFAPLIAVYQGPSLDNLSSIVNSSEAWGPPGQLQDFFANNVQFNTLSNSVYYIAVDGIGQSNGTFTLTSQFTPAPTNNYFASRILLPANFTSVTGSNGGANFETNEPVHSGAAPGASVWWSWTPAQTGAVTLATAGSSFDTILDIYTNATLSALSLFTGNDNEFVFSNTAGPTFDPQSRVKFTAQAGTPYQVCVSGARNATGAIVLNNLTIAIDNILSSQNASQPDATVAFTNVLDLANLRASTTGPLRLSLWAKPGYSYQRHLAVDNQFLASLNVPEEQIGVTNLPAPGTLGPDATAHLTVSGVCPAPFYFTNFSSIGSAEVFGVGYSVLAMLEEQVAGVWQTRDSRLILVGNWPNIGDFQGQNAGVITLTSAFANSASNYTFVQINFGPPAAARLGGLWRFSPTNFGNAGEFKYFTNYINAPLKAYLVLSTNFSVELTNLPGFIFPANSEISFTPGGIIPLNLFYSVMQPYLDFDRSKGLGMTGTAGTAYRIETTSKPTNSATWTLVTNNLLGAGTNWVTNTSLSPITNRFYRAIWLTN